MRPIGYALIALLVVHVPIHLMVIDATFDRVDLLDRSSAGGGVTFAQLDGVEARMLSAGRWGFLLLVITAIVWPVWQYQGHANVIRRRVDGLRFTPGWAVSWWFIPIANLWKPFQAISELARTSDAPDAWSAARRPWVMIPWWLTWIAGTSITRAISIQGPPSSLQALRRQDLAMIVASACTVAAAILGAAIVAAVTADQERMAATAPPLFGAAAP
jgi:hypothetical protein